jgi:hypothetical protein
MSEHHQLKEIFLFTHIRQQHVQSHDRKWLPTFSLNLMTVYQAILHNSLVLAYLSLS